MMRRACGNGAVQRPPIIMMEGEDVFEFHEILKHRPAYKTSHNTRIQCLVQWKGYGPVYNDVPQASQPS